MAVERLETQCARPEVARDLWARLCRGHRSQVGIRLGDDTWLSGHRQMPCILTLYHPGIIRDLANRLDAQVLIDAYLQGDIDANGDLQAACSLAQHLAVQSWPWYDRLDLRWRARQLERRPTQPRPQPAEAVANGRAAISQHYDSPTAFFRLWLDPEMVYSGAYFANDEQTLADAQRDKLEYVCRKLRLMPGDTLLDVGCGWGGLICWAARHYAVQAHGITLSRRQYEFVRQRITSEGLAGRVTVSLQDYRQLPAEPRYDKIASINLIEHLGASSLPEFFAAAHRLLKPDGLMLTHGVTNAYGRQNNTFTRFVNGYIMPDASLSRLSDVSEAMTEAGWELHDVENLRRHYAMTLRHWSFRLDACADAARRMVGDGNYRLWRLYLAGAAHLFNEGALNAFEILASQEGARVAVPWRREPFAPPITKNPPPVPWGYRRAA